MLETHGLGMLLEVCYKNDNVYADISGFVYGDFSLKDSLYFSKMIKEFLEISSSDKLLFGTDWPISNQDAYVDMMHHQFDESIYSRSYDTKYSKGV